LQPPRSLLNNLPLSSSLSRQASVEHRPLDKRISKVAPVPRIKPYSRIKLVYRVWGCRSGGGDENNWPAGSGSSAYYWNWIAKVFGLLLTAGAASLGAPFWFDMLNKVVSIRSAGKAPEEKQKSPKEVPTPTEAGQTPREARESRDVLSELRGTPSESPEGLKSKPL